MVRDVAFAGRSRSARFALAVCGARTLAALTDGPGAAWVLTEVQAAFYASADPEALRAIAERGRVSAVVVEGDRLMLVSTGELPVWRVGRRVERLLAPEVLRGPIALAADAAVVLATGSLFDAAGLGGLDRRFPAEDLERLLEGSPLPGVAIAVGACEPVVHALRRAGESGQRV